MKALYFFKKEKGDEVNVGYIFTHDEKLREAFSNKGYPTSLYVVDGKPYYMSWMTKHAHKFLEFAIRYEEINANEFTYKKLYPVRNDYDIYFEYVFKWIGK